MCVRDRDERERQRETKERERERKRESERDRDRERETERDYEYVIGVMRTQVTHRANNTLWTISEGVNQSAWLKQSTEMLRG